MIQVVTSEDGSERINAVMPEFAASFDVATARLIAHSPLTGGAFLAPLETPHPGVFSPRFITPTSDSGVWAHLCAQTPEGTLVSLLQHAEWHIVSHSEDESTVTVTFATETDSDDRPLALQLVYTLTARSVHAKLSGALLASAKESLSVESGLFATVRVSNVMRVGLDGAGGAGWENLAIHTSSQGLEPVDAGDESAEPGAKRQRSPCARMSHAARERPSASRVLRDTTDAIVCAANAGGVLNIRDPDSRRLLSVKAGSSTHLRTRKVLPGGPVDDGAWKSTLTVGAGCFAVDTASTDLCTALDPGAPMTALAEIDVSDASTHHVSVFHG